MSQPRHLIHLRGICQFIGVEAVLRNYDTDNDMAVKQWKHF